MLVIFVKAISVRNTEGLASEMMWCLRFILHTPGVESVERG